MKIYKIVNAQKQKQKQKQKRCSQIHFAWLLSPEKSKVLQGIFKALPGRLNKTDRITTDSKELAFNDTGGDAYISLSFNSDQNAMHVEKYYESEFMQNEYGKVFNVPVNWENPKETITQVINIIKSWIGTDSINRNTINAENNGPYMVKTAILTKNEIIERLRTWNFYLKKEKDLEVIKTIKETIDTLRKMLDLTNSIQTSTKKVEEYKP